MTDTASNVTRSPRPAKAFIPRVARALSFQNISAIYILIALLITFSLWVPDTFLTAPVWHSLIDSSAITALATIGLVLPLAAGVFNLAIGSEIGLGAILVAWLLAHQGIPMGLALVITIVSGAAIGVVSGLLVTKAHIDSFISTLGMSSVLLAVIAWISQGQQILDLGAGFQKVATHKLLGVTYPVWIMLTVGLLVWYILERTAAGRRIYATGGNEPAARLAGVSTSTVIILTLASCGAIAGLSGSLISSQLATGDPTVGPGYMLPAYAAAFLGSTQFRGGRYNVWGAVLAVYVLAVGVKGLQLAGAPVWIPDLFNGLALLIAVAMSRLQRFAIRTGAVKRALRRSRSHDVTEAMIQPREAKSLLDANPPTETGEFLPTQAR